ncbi:hypothetical protein ACJRO7_001940 [Eucalyptus globulus]|uniref:non-specific serine/threonine protein kinase n=1 Tax=Eucalyptus globulus TaxID=34317 RepID=A0ABD3LSL1_EUCGL
MENITPSSTRLIPQEQPINDTSQMQLTQEGDLVLLGDDGKKMWSTNTTGKSVEGLNLTEVGNLVLYNRNDAIIWQSFDHPVDTILPRQELRPGIQLTTTSSAHDGTARVYTFTTDDQRGFVASVRVANSPQIYYKTGDVRKTKSDNGQVGALYKNGTFSEFEFSPSFPQFILLGGDGHLYLNVYDEHTQPIVRASSNGCNRTSPFSCDSHDNTFTEVENVTFFASSYNNISANISDTTVESCKEECLKKGCSCTMTLFQNQANFFGGDYFLLSDLFSLVDNSYEGYSTLAFIKVNHSSNTPIPSRKRRGGTVLILGTTVGAVSVVLVSIFGIYILSKVRRNDVEDDDLDLPRLQITRFPYEDLKAMHLDGFGQMKKSFLVEAETIDTIHHVNLVRLLGFCAEKSHRLLVYEYMCNVVRRKIILNIAKGLAYLHGECHKKIIHLDIKPQNILLDEHFNAKLANFGLSKLINKDQSHVMTTMRGTLGYLAPEWLSYVITEKVDMYSFGIVMLEVLCGRKNVDRSLPSDEVHMLTLFKCKAEQEQLLEMVDKSNGDMQLHGQEAVKMMKIAAWCLQDDSSMTPPMSQVVKCLEGSADIEDGLRYSF